MAVPSQHSNTSVQVDYSIAILSSRETAQTLQRCLDTTIQGLGERRALIDVLINGNHDLSLQVRQILQDYENTASVPENISIRLWEKSFADKASAWNSYIHQIWPLSQKCFFLDGYAFPHKNSFNDMAKMLDQNPYHHAVSAVPTQGRSAPLLRKAMADTSGLHGNCHALRGEVVSRFRDISFHLPQGLYRVDSLIGAALKYNLDPSHHRWRNGRIGVCLDASWDIPNEQSFIQQVKQFVKRRFRQSRGVLENHAIGEIFSIRKQPLSALPEQASELMSRCQRKTLKGKWALIKKDPLLLYYFLFSSAADHSSLKSESATLVFGLNTPHHAENQKIEDDFEKVA